MPNLKKSSPHPYHVMIIAGEPSGDLHGSYLVRALHRKNPALTITGIGGDRMQAEGMSLFFHIRNLSVMGVWEVLGQIRTIKQAFSTFRHHLIQDRPNLLILIDYPGFNLKAAEFCHKQSIPVLYYVTPKVWAWNRSRLKKIKRYVDHAALIFPFEEAIYKKAGVPATFVGNPLVEQLCEDADATMEGKKNSERETISIGLLPGSRISEIKALLGVMLETGKQIHEASPNTVFLLSLAPSIQKSPEHLAVFNEILNTSGFQDHVEVVTAPSSHFFSRSDFLIAASGTVTLEAAIRGIPMVIIYKVSPLTAFFGRRFLKISHVGLPNIVANYGVVPELIQEDAEPDIITETVMAIIESPRVMDRMGHRLKLLKHRLGGRGASVGVAHIALKMLQKRG